MTATPSLRRRVTLTVLGLFAILLVLAGVLVDVALGAQLGRDLNSRLSDRVSRAEQLADQGASPPQLVSQLQGQDIRVRVVTADGDSYGDPGLGPLGPGDAPQSPPKPPPPPVESVPGDDRAGSPGPPTPPDKTSTTVTKVLSDGNTVVLVGDTTAISDVRRQLRVVMAVAAVAAMIVAALVLLGGIATALRPLDRMTTLARRITAGDRGSRLAPNRPRTELGRAAAAFDDMLDALEDAESRARSAAVQARRAADETRGFLADAAHELRTPLAGIQAVAESLASAVDPRDEQQQHRALMLVRETVRAGRLVADMLDLARIEEGVELQLSDVDLVALVSAETARVRELSPAITMTTTAPPPPVVVRADPVRVAQILTNLLDNARRHTGPDGTITITVTTDEQTATVVVANTGQPVAEAERERIFGRLVRLQEARDRDTGGAGLGLPVARGLARAHRGDLVCDPRDDGASFRLTLPAGHDPDHDPLRP